MSWKSKPLRRAPRPQRLERRELLAADPIHVGVVYLETDYLESENDVGSDSRGDRFMLSFTGGAPGTTLSQLRVVTDKDGDGISVGDPIFDTELGGRGKAGAHDFQILSIETGDGRTATARATVADGGQVLVLDLENFRAGDRLEFSLDVDEVLRNSLDLAVFNDRLDVITSGQEFQDSILEAVFEAPHFEQATADSIFLNDYGTPNDSYGLDLPPDDGGPDSRPNRSAAAIASTVQVPKPVSIRGGVWMDADLDAVWESGELGIADVTLSLYSSDGQGGYVDTGFRTQTDQDGRYSFPKSLGLLPGDYRVVQTQPSGMFSVAAVPGTIDGQPSGVATSPDILSSIQFSLGDTEAIEMNFAEAAPASIGGFVYSDKNNNGVRDPGEAGIEGVAVRLEAIDTIAQQSSIVVETDASGAYAFEGIAPGQYRIVEITQPADYVDGIDAAGTIDGNTVGRAINPGDSIVDIRVGGGESGIEYNFGELAVGEISGFVFLIAPGEDCTGIYDPDDHEALEGVLVELQTADGTTVAETRTSSAGTYHFDAVAPGNYRIVQTTPDGLLDGQSHVGTIDSVRNGVSVDGTLIRQISMSPGGVGVEYNFCEIAPATISGSVYHDRSDDGVRDGNEDGIGGTKVTLTDEHGDVVASTVTDSDGRYEFTGLEPGNFRLIEEQPAGYLDGSDSAGRIGSQTVGRATNDSIEDIELPQGVTAVEYNFGELLPATIAGTVHVDLNGNCVQDEGEAGLAGVVMRLLDENGNEVARGTTDVDGNYRFYDLRPGRYTVVQDQPDGLFDGGATPGSHGGVSGENWISDVDLGSGAEATDYDFCEEPPTGISGAVYVDSDQDCIRDPGEVGIEGVVIELRDAAGNLVATTQTDGDGNYRFDQLRSGQYTIHEIQPEGYFHGGQTLGSLGGTVLGVDLMSVSLEPGQSAVDYLFCEYEPVSVSGSVWSDNNQNQVHDPDEDPISEVSIKLINEDGVVVRTTKTDLSGSYRFDQLPPGVYRVCQQQPEDFFHGGQIVGSHGGSVAEDDLIVAIELRSGDVATDYGFPEIPPAMVSGFVFIDGEPIQSEIPIDSSIVHQYRDGIFTSDDTPLEGVRVEIRDHNGDPLGDDAFLDGDADSSSVVYTDGEGFYQIRGLRPGVYTLFQSQPDGLIDSIDTPGTSGGMAVNPGDQYSESERMRIESISGTDSFDAIIDVTLVSQGHSEHNNFSEVEFELVVPPPPPPIDPPPEEPPQVDYPRQPDPPREWVVSPEIPVLEQKDILYGESIRERLLKTPVIGGVDEMTWHLSVINGGYPSGALRSGRQFREAAFKVNSDSWNGDADKSQGQWRLLTIEGEVREESQRMKLGAEDAIALVGDFNGDGKDETAIFVGGRWFVDLNGNGVWDSGDLWILMGTEMDRPVVGDWDGDGKDDIAIFGRKWENDLPRVQYDPGLPDPSNRSRKFLASSQMAALASAKIHDHEEERWLKQGPQGELRADAVDHVFMFGQDVDAPVSGDWNGDGIDQIGVFRAGTWILDTEGDGRETTNEVTFEFGQPGDRPIVGDFDGDGIDEVGVIRGNRWIIDSDGDRRLTAADRQIEIPAGDENDQPVVGDWDGDGKDEPGYYRRAG